jgi:hypothetical protein
LLWTLWPSIARCETVRLGLIDFKRPRILAWLFVSAVPVLLAVMIATFPGEWFEKLRLVPTTWEAWTAPSVEATQKRDSGWATLYELLVASHVSLVTDRKGWWSNVLVLPDFKAGDRRQIRRRG